MLTTSRTRDPPTTTSGEAPPSVQRAAPNGARHRRGVPAPSRDERRNNRRLALIGVAGAVAVATALVLIVVSHTDGPNAVEADVSQRPNADVPAELIVTDASPAEGPGSNSLNVTSPDGAVIDEQQTDVTPWPAGEGPGSNSLNVTGPDGAVIDEQQTDVTPWPAGEGPGANSLNVEEP